MNRIDWDEMLRHFVQVLAFGFVVATVQYGFQPEHPYAPVVVFSLLISVSIWVLIDFGRLVFPCEDGTGWPSGSKRLVLIAGGIVGGWFLGNWIANRLCKAWGLFDNLPPPTDPVADLRSSVLITIIAGTVATYYFHNAARSSQLERQMAEARKHADEARLKLLETQLEPHMLFNTLANLRALIGVDPNRAQAMLDHMIAYLRATLNASRATSHSLQAEFDRIQDYLELMSIRMGARLKFTLDLPGQLASAKVPSLLLQPLVENAIQHGLEPKVGGGEIRVAARRDDNEIVIEVQDTGVGCEDTLRAAGKGFGMTQVRERLATLYADKASIDFGNVDTGGCRVVIRYPAEA